MDNKHLSDILPIYFSRLFPFDDFYRWLSYGDEKTFACREFAYNFEGQRFLRNQSYRNIDALKQHVKKIRPTKIDIGAVHNAPPQDHLKQTYYYVVQKELMFDIDITDYDEVRSCCSGTDICSKCWKFMVLAMKILDTAMREDFGFDDILWVFSGRRGIHAWVCDENARKLKADVRFGVGSYLQIVNGGEYMKKKVEIGDRMHPSVRRAVKFIEPVFLDMCVKEQDILGTEGRVEKFLGIIAEEMREEVKELLDQHPTSLTKWEAFVNFFKEQIEAKSEKWCKTPFLIQEIMIQYSYPRLDIHVTIGMSHLLKAPFCVHPKSGKIGVPIDLEAANKFDLETIPTIDQLFEEIDLYDRNARKQGIFPDELKKIADIEKTSLNQYLRFFRNFIDKLQFSKSTDDIKEELTSSLGA